MNILITGGTGLIGSRLVSVLIENNMSPRLLSRQADQSDRVPKFEWDLKKGWIDPKALENLDVLIHLAGANVSEGRWTAARKNDIMDSRINSTQLLYNTIEQLEHKPKLMISASATGYYGLKEFAHESSEEEDPGEDFLAGVCVAWEAQADKFEALGMRVVKVRTGVVLDPKGGALPKIVQPIKLYAGAPLATGQQFINWIHWEDWCHAILHFIGKTNLSGAYNLVAPNPETNASCTRLIAKTIKRPLWLPNVPAFVLKLMLGEMASIVICGHKVSSKKIEEAGYQFKYEELRGALTELLADD